MSTPPAIRLGAQGWNYPAWVGPFYPPRTRASDFLSVYARAFDTARHAASMSCNGTCASGFRRRASAAQNSAMRSFMRSHQDAAFAASQA